MTLLLHNYRRCPFCIRVRIVLYLKKIEYEIVEEPLREWTPWMKDWSESNNEKARVPVLRVTHDDGVENIIPESNDINLFLDELGGQLAFTPQKNTKSYNEMLSWFSWCDTTLKPAIDNYKYGEHLEFTKEKHVIHTLRLQECMQHLENALTTRNYLVEERLTLADISIIPFIRQIMRTREGEFSFELYTRVYEWTTAITETDWFKDEVMKKVSVKSTV